MYVLHHVEVGAHNSHSFSKFGTTTKFAHCNVLEKSMCEKILDRTFEDNNDYGSFKPGSLVGHACRVCCPIAC